MTAMGFTTLGSLVGRLPEGERRLVCLRWADGLDDREIAALTGDDPVHVTARLAAIEQVLFEGLYPAADLGDDAAIAA